MIISAIVAMDEQRGIGIGNQLPWRLSADLQLFKKHTLGHHIVFGRKTFESIGKALPGRTTIIITRSADFMHEGCHTAHSVEQAIALARASQETELFICGGAEIYGQALPFLHRLYLTQVHATVSADTFFPQLVDNKWNTIHSEHFPANEKNQYDFTFSIRERIAE